MPSINKSILILSAQFQGRMIKSGLILWITLISFVTIAYGGPVSSAKSGSAKSGSTQIAPLSQFPIQEYNPDQVIFQAYHSYKYHIVLFSFTQKESRTSRCQPNQYYFYDYQKEVFFLVEASDLKVSPNFQNLFFGKIFRYGQSSSKDLKPLQKRMKAFADSTKASSDTLKAAQKTVANPPTRCWQQGAWMTRDKQIPYPLPFLLASFCKADFCPSFQWQGNDTVQTWAKMEPTKLQQIQIKLQSKATRGKILYQKTSKPFYQKWRAQSNAPRASVIKDQKGGHYKLPSKKYSKTWFTWAVGAKGMAQVTLNRSTVDIKAAKRWQKSMDPSGPNLAQKIAFGLWLDLDNRELIYQKLLSALKIKDYLGFFHSLRNDFDYKERIGLCRKIHQDRTLQKHWKEKSFIDLFNENCPR